MTKKKKKRVSKRKNCSDLAKLQFCILYQINFQKLFCSNKI